MSDLNGNVTNVVCPMYSRMTRGCLKKVESNPSPFVIALKKLGDQLFDVRLNYCEFIKLK